MFLTWLFRSLSSKKVDAGPVGPDGYRVFTRKFDEVASAEDLLRRAGLVLAANEAAKGFTEVMHARVSGLTTQAIVAAENGVIAPDKSSVPLITLLIDLSGSMKGVSSQLATFCAEAVTALCDAFGAKLEVLGFTTVNWRGEPARTAWNGRRGKGSANLPIQDGSAV